MEYSKMFVNSISKLTHAIIIITLLCAFSFSGTLACKKKFRNYVDIEQFNTDSSNNYRHIFKKTIEEERRKENRYKKNEFKD